jgi:hypothetical protein
MYIYIYICIYICVYMYVRVYVSLCMLQMIVAWQLSLLSLSSHDSRSLTPMLPTLTQETDLTASFSGQSATPTKVPACLLL